MAGRCPRAGDAESVIGLSFTNCVWPIAATALALAIISELVHRPHLKGGLSAEVGCSDMHTRRSVRFERP